MSEQNGLPVLYSFRRCPYAMRARMALWVSGTQAELREVVLRDKPQAMLDASPKGTVPVLVLDDGEVIDESIAIMRWSLALHDPAGWLAHETEAQAIIAEIDGPFKTHLDRYKYHSRYDDADPDHHRSEALRILERLNARIAEHGQLLAGQATLADYASFPFIRQFANHDRAWFDMQPLIPLQNWLVRHLQSAIFKSVMHKYDQWIAGRDKGVRFPPATA